jgi:hypothetical protein
MFSLAGRVSFNAPKLALTPEDKPDPVADTGKEVFPEVASFGRGWFGIFVAVGENGGRPKDVAGTGTGLTVTFGAGILSFEDTGFTVTTGGPGLGLSVVLMANSVLL